MLDIKRDMAPGIGMIWHISIGTTILALTVFRIGWRLAHPVAPESSLPAYQRVTSGMMHWLLYAVILATTLSGWLFASARGWKIAWFFVAPLPMLTAKNSSLLHAIDGWHQVFEWTLLFVIGGHILAAVVHVVYYRDGVMRRML